MPDPKAQNKEKEHWVDKTELTPEEWEVIKNYNPDKANLVPLSESTIFDDDDEDDVS